MNWRAGEKEGKTGRLVKMVFHKNFLGVGIKSSREISDIFLRKCIELHSYWIWEIKKNDI